MPKRLKLSYHDQINLCIKRAKREKNAEMIVYYKQALNCSAVASFDIFKRSWAYSEWVKKNAQEIQNEEFQIKRFTF